MSRILIVDDEASIGWTFREFLNDQGHQVRLAATAEDALQAADAERFDAVLLDVRLPGMDGISAIAPLRERVGSAPILVMTAFGNLETTVRALEAGAFDYLVKPFDLDQAASALARALDQGRSKRDEAKSPSSPSNNDIDVDALIGSSPAIRELFKRIALAAGSDAPVLIRGESGSGKELAARAIHRHSARRDGNFVAVNLAALNPSLIESELFGHVKGAFTGAVGDRKGVFEYATGGTVFLDEIGETPLSVQVKLLRALERKEVTPVGDPRPRPIDIRIIAATHRDLPERIQAGEFREDFFYRLSVFPIHVPSLTERRDDIPVLAEHFLRLARPDANSNHQLGEDVRQALTARHWPGNVRELRNAIEHAAILARGGPIRAELLPAAPLHSTRRGPDPEEAIAAHLEAWVRGTADSPSEEGLYEDFLKLVEPPLLRAALAHCGHNRAATATLLGLHRATLRQKLRKREIDPDPEGS